MHRRCSGFFAEFLYVRSTYRFLHVRDPNATVANHRVKVMVVEDVGYPTALDSGRFCLNGLAPNGSASLSTD
jgi:hypothetical protein